MNPKTSIACFSEEGVDEGSSIKLTITYGIFNIPVNTETFDLCSVASKGCPLSPGDVTLSISDEIPGFSPPVSNAQID